MTVQIVVSLVIFIYVTCMVSSKKIQTQNNQSNVVCGGVFTEISFFLQSPNYPQEYPPNLNCIYLIEGQDCPTYYEFDFIDFRLENSVGCVKDRLLIENQDALCGKKSNKGYFKSNGSLNVEFLTNNNTSDRGFKIFVTRKPCESSKKEANTNKTTHMTVSRTIRTAKPFQPFYSEIPKFEENNIQYCWNIFDFRRFLINFPYNLKCRRENRQEDTWNNCIELNQHRGYFRSPGYPFFYPKILNMCFRFRKQPGYCAIRLYMNDFQLQSSYECQKDYVLLENQHRYCGRSLLRQYITFDLTSKNYEDLRFVTDLFFCGRGFCGSYEQLPCQQPTVPINLTTTTVPPSPTPNVIGCDRYISDQSFTLEMNQNKANCIFEIKKFTKSACKVDFHFEKFDLFCGSESLLMNNITLCGHLTDRKISVNFDEYYGIVTVVYRSNLLNKYSDFKFKITGQQVTDDCLIPEPPAQLTSFKRFN
ncbi:tolloid-like protein 1 [Diorhabda sublineata]|uniref:tolloid-like protein 1 n=1 Tax=Diorhabda sublineata TaxID=1163346 RepID=UPI0024E0BFD0|nr:tolloid-like protein 1 [Diorhabda sublineata]